MIPTEHEHCSPFPLLYVVVIVLLLLLCTGPYKVRSHYWSHTPDLDEHNKSNCSIKVDSSSRIRIIGLVVHALFKQSERSNIVAYIAIELRCNILFGSPSQLIYLSLRSMCWGQIHSSDLGLIPSRPPLLNVFPHFLSHSVAVLSSKG